MQGIIDFLTSLGSGSIGDVLGFSEFNLIDLYSWLPADILSTLLAIFIFLLILAIARIVL